MERTPIKTSYLKFLPLKQTQKPTVFTLYYKLKLLYYPLYKHSLQTVVGTFCFHFIMEPYWNMSRIKQIIGRANRFCSHKDINKDRRYVDVYLYLATKTGVKTTDEYRPY